MRGDALILLSSMHTALLKVPVEFLTVLGLLVLRKRPPSCGMVLLQPAAAAGLFKPQVVRKDVLAKRWQACPRQLSSARLVSLALGHCRQPKEGLRQILQHLRSKLTVPIHSRVALACNEHSSMPQR